MCITIMRNCYSHKEARDDKRARKYENITAARTGAFAYILNWKHVLITSSSLVTLPALIQISIIINMGKYLRDFSSICFDLIKLLFKSQSFWRSEHRNKPMGSCEPLSEWYSIDIWMAQVLWRVHVIIALEPKKDRFGRQRIAQRTHLQQ